MNMFENTATCEALGVVQSHVFDSHDDLMGADRIDAIKALDRSIRAAQAEQARQIAALDRLRASQISLGSGDHSLSVIGELGMVRNISPSAAGTQYGFAVGLARLPKVAGVFAAGGICELTARAIVNEATGLDADQIVLFDEHLDGKLTGLTPRKAANLARATTIGIDADAAYERAKANRSNRFVTLHPDRDGISVLHARGPAEQLLAVYQSLQGTAATAKTTGDGRKRGQIMFDELIARGTGQKAATDLKIEIGLLMTTGSLMRTDTLPATLVGYGPIPPELALELAHAAQYAWLRRIFTDPIDGSITDCDQKRRRFDGPLRYLITTRDLTCRQPGCDLLITQLDHIRAHRHRGPTTLANGQGLCTRSHTLKHLPNWQVRSVGSSIRWTTPTGHSYVSDEPPVFEYLPEPKRPPRHFRQ